jgi:uncharacterized membrane protein
MRSKLVESCALAAAAALLTACSQGNGSAGSSGQASGTACPQGSDLTYETFARSFMQSYCTRCHSSALSNSQRRGAPSDHNFDTLEGLRATEPEHIDEQAAAGPDGVNTAMPPTAPKPTDAERRDLGEWLACGMP